jgi:hypothetical protein
MTWRGRAQGATALAAALAQNPPLSELGLNSNLLSDVGIAAIAAALTTNTRLEVKHPTVYCTAFGGHATFDPLLSSLALVSLSAGPLRIDLIVGRSSVLPKTKSAGSR